METENEIVTEDVKSEESEINETEAPEETTAELAARLKRAEAKIERMKLDQKVEKKVEVELQKKTGELDNADYAFLAVKGYEHDDDIKLISEKMQKWNLPLRELLKDEDVVNKLKSMRIEREALAATPGSTRRSSGNAADTEEYFYQKYEQTGKLPDNMPHGMAEKLINRKYAEANPRQNPYE